MPTFLKSSRNMKNDPKNLFFPPWITFFLTVPLMLGFSGWVMVDGCVFCLFLPLTAGCGWQGSSRWILLTSSIQLLMRRVIPGGLRQIIPLPSVVQGQFWTLSSQMSTLILWRIATNFPVLPHWLTPDFLLLLQTSGHSSSSNPALVCFW